MQRKTAKKWKSSNTYIRKAPIIRSGAILFDKVGKVYEIMRIYRVKLCYNSIVE